MFVESIEFDIIGCKKCSISSKVKNYVVGRGNAKDSVILFVGEGPGRNEDETGLAFQGAAGKVLNEEITRIGLKDNDYYIANVLKCRPFDENGKNRKPSPEEIKNCIDFLSRQIELLKPKIIVMLGVTAKDAVRSLKNIPAETIMIEALHPAALLYRKEYRHKFTESFNYLKSIFESIGGRERVK